MCDCYLIVIKTLSLTTFFFSFGMQLPRSGTFGAYVLHRLAVQAELRFRTFGYTEVKVLNHRYNIQLIRSV